MKCLQSDITSFFSRASKRPAVDVVALAPADVGSAAVVCAAVDTPSVGPAAVVPAAVGFVAGVPALVSPAVGPAAAAPAAVGPAAYVPAAVGPAMGVPAAVGSPAVGLIAAGPTANIGLFHGGDIGYAVRLRRQGKFSLTVIFFQIYIMFCSFRATSA